MTYRWTREILLGDFKIWGKRWTCRWCRAKADHICDIEHHDWCQLIEQEPCDMPCRVSVRA